MFSNLWGVVNVVVNIDDSDHSDGNNSARSNAFLLYAAFASPPLFLYALYLFMINLIVM